MNGDRCDRALARIAAAAGRIEAAARKPQAGGDDTELATLRGRHDRLRTAVAQSLSEIDQLIAGRS